MIARASIVSGQGPKWRSTTVIDLDAIERIANVVHPDLSESREVFAEKLRLFPEGCFVLAEDGVVLGYAFIHPWLVNDIPKLNEFLLRIPSKPGCLLIHDVAVLRQARGKGASKALLERIEKLAKEREIPNLTLVSVYNSHLHWARLGFEVLSNEVIAGKLNSYGETARYMIRRLR
jgi:GNAT superfamily N-acetyltransferase